MKQPESETFEYKSQHAGDEKQRAQLIQTIVAMANTKGGTIHLEKVICQPRDLDSARLDDLVNTHIEPRLSGITSSAMVSGAIEITVPESDCKPHVFRTCLSYVAPSGKTITAFHPGQIWARHSSKSEPATSDDIEKLLRQRLSAMLQGLGEHVLHPEFALALQPEGGAPVTLSSEPGALPLAAPDIDKLYPYRAKDLGRILGKPVGWVSKAAEVLGLKDDRTATQGLKQSSKVVQWRYNQKVLQRLQEKLAANPSWNPYQQARASRWAFSAAIRTDKSAD